MAKKENNLVPISVRISQEDADFIQKLHVEGAKKPSEKIRELLKQARLTHTQTRDYGSALTAQMQFFQAAKYDVLHAEKQSGVHSHMFEQLPDLGATLAADLPEEADLDSLRRYERELMWRIVRLADSILLLAVTSKGAAYDDTVLQQLENTLKLAEIAQESNNSFK